MPFDAKDLAHRFTRELTAMIAGSERNMLVKAPTNDALTNAALLVQAGFRGLLPVDERAGIALPPDVPPSGEPTALARAQSNAHRVLTSNVEVTPNQRRAALAAILAASESLRAMGYDQFASQLDEYLDTQYAPGKKPKRPAPAKRHGPNGQLKH